MFIKAGAAITCSQNLLADWCVMWCGSLMLNVIVMVKIIRLSVSVIYAKGPSVDNKNRLLIFVIWSFLLAVKMIVTMNSLIVIIVMANGMRNRY